MAAREDFQHQINAATQRLLRTVGALGEHGVRHVSALPGWTRGHVATHIARSADAMSDLLEGARAGVAVEAYASREARDAATEEGAGRGVAALLADLATSARRFEDAVAAVPEHAWQRAVRVLGGAEFPLAQLLQRRLVEVELHHTDLDAGYRPQDWPARFAEMELPEPMQTQRDDRAAGRTSR